MAKILALMMMATLMGSCSKSSAQSSDALFFRQEIINYNFVRYENTEAICYKRGDQISCLKKD
jgi:hypothetical protein